MAWKNELIAGSSIDLWLPDFENPFDQRLIDWLDETQPGLSDHLTKINTQYESSSVFRFRLKRTIIGTTFNNLLMKCVYRQMCASEVNAKIHTINVETGEYIEKLVLDEPFAFDDPSRSGELMQALSNERIMGAFKQLAELPVEAGHFHLCACPVKFAAISFIFGKQNRTTLTDELVPMSVASATNVPGYEEPQVFVSDGNSATFISKWLTYLYEVSEKAEEIMVERFQRTIDQLAAKIGNYTKLRKDLKKAMIKLHKLKKEQPNNLQEIQRAGGEASFARVAFYESERYEVIRGQFMRWIRQLPVIGFNSVCT